jgi:hypothetical protein
MANTDFNVGAGVKAPRKLLKHYVNVGTKEEKDWELIGIGVEDSAIETNFEEEEVLDIYQNFSSSVTGAKPTQSFDPFTVRGGSKLAFMLHEIWLNKEYEKLSQFEMLTVYSHVGDTSEGYDATIEEDCTITFSSVGGSAYIDMPITVKYSDKKQRGTVTFGAEDKAPVFVASDAA